jgi:hypothetical protein
MWPFIFVCLYIPMTKYIAILAIAVLVLLYTQTRRTPRMYRGGLLARSEDALEDVRDIQAIEGDDAEFHETETMHLSEEPQWNAQKRKVWNPKFGITSSQESRQPRFDIYQDVRETRAPKHVERVKGSMGHPAAAEEVITEAHPGRQKKCPSLVSRMPMHLAGEETSRALHDYYEDAQPFYSFE